MRAWLALMLLVVPLAARAQSDGRWGEGTWSGDDEYPDPTPAAASPLDGYADRDEPPPPPYDDRFDEAGPTMADFHEGLDAYGQWVESAEYGIVWQPASVGYAWHPYWDGRWVYTHSGWTWVSAEPWGWATYHYGRWTYLGDRGWVWLPGRVWASAWVAWRYGDGYAGWCPLGPHGSTWDNPRYWVFVDARNLLEPVRGHAVAMPQVTFPRVRPLPIGRPGPRAGPAPRTVEKQTRVPIHAVPVVDARTRAHAMLMSSGAVPMYRPRSAPIVRAQPATSRYWNVPSRGAAPAAKPATSSAVKGAPAPAGSKH